MPPSASNPSDFSPGAGVEDTARFAASHQHSAFSATLLLMVSVMLARVIGYLREMYVAWAFGAGPKTDAYIAAFPIPDFFSIFLREGRCNHHLHLDLCAAHVARRRAAGAARFRFHVTIMTMVALMGTILVEIFTPQMARLVFP